MTTEGSSLFDSPVDYDLLASPQDVAVTWSPARFIMEPNGTNLYAIEIGGGIIHFPQTSSKAGPSVALYAPPMILAVSLKSFEGVDGLPCVNFFSFLRDRLCQTAIHHSGAAW